MTVYEIPNIEHCSIEDGGTWYCIVSHEGWYIHLNDGIEDTINIYKGAVVLPYNYPFEQVQIIAETDLPENAEICGVGTDDKVS